MSRRDLAVDAAIDSIRVRPGADNNLVGSVVWVEPALLVVERPVVGPGADGRIAESERPEGTDHRLRGDGTGAQHEVVPDRADRRILAEPDLRSGAHRKRGAGNRDACDGDRRESIRTHDLPPS